MNDLDGAFDRTGMNFVRGAFDLWVIRHFWRPLLVAIPSVIVAALIDHGNQAVNWALFGALFAVSEAVFLVLAKRRRA